MSEKKQLNQEELEKVTGGATIVNADTRTEEELEKEEYERQLKALQDILNSGGQSYQESLELLRKISELTRKIEGSSSNGVIIIT